MQCAKCLEIQLNRKSQIHKFQTQNKPKTKEETVHIATFLSNLSHMVFFVLTLKTIFFNLKFVSMTLKRRGRVKVIINTT